MPAHIQSIPHLVRIRHLGKTSELISNAALNTVRFHLLKTLTIKSAHGLLRGAILNKNLTPLDRMETLRNFNVETQNSEITLLSIEPLNSVLKRME